jgi:hypothetical protein
MVESIFMKLIFTYGRDFLSKYEGLDLDMVKAEWAHELAGFADMPNAIKYGLAHLDPHKAPNVLQFKDLCRRAPREGMLRLSENFKRTPEADALFAKTMLEVKRRLRAQKADEEQ